MILFETLPEDETARVLCAWGLALMLLDAFYRSYSPDPNARVPEGYTLNLLGNGPEIQSYVWTALMILAPTGRPGFDRKKTITFASYAEFKPSSQYNIFGNFKNSSLNKRVFMPVLQGLTVAYNPDEANLGFGHHVPSKYEYLLETVQKYLCKCITASFFKVDLQTKTFGQGDRSPDYLHFIGAVKIAFVMLALARDLIEYVDLSGIKASQFSVVDLDIILTCCEGMKTISLRTNQLSKFGVTDLCKILARVPASVTMLNLECNELNKFRENELMQIMQAIPKTVTVVKLGINDLADALITRLQNSRSATQGVPASIARSVQSASSSSSTASSRSGLFAAGAAPSTLPSAPEYKYEPLPPYSL